MTKSKNIKLAVLLATIFTNYAVAEVEVTGKITHETSSYTERGLTNGLLGTYYNGTDGTRDSKDNGPFKDETSARIYIDGNIGADNDYAYHLELQGFNDGAAIANYDNNKNDTQRELLREAYIDTNVGENWAVRLGKQQTVWGTADGMKLLDAINPTDFSELVQNQMEDSRIPVWMVNAERINDDGSQFQIIASESKSNFIPGLSTISDGGNRSTTIARTGALYNSSGTSTLNIPAVDKGHPFIMKGVDAISGETNGMLNLVPAMGDVAHTFAILASGFANSYNSANYNLENWTYATVEEFVNNAGAGAGFAGACAYYGFRGAKASAACLEAIENNTNVNDVNLFSGMGGNEDDNSNYDTTNPDTVFEYMPDTTFATFARFANASTKYVREGTEAAANIGFRFKDTTSNGLNYSLNYLNGSDPNPYIDMEWQDSIGRTLTVSESIDTTGGGNGATGYRTVTLTDPDGLTGYGILGAGQKGILPQNNPVTLVMKEKNAKIHNIGGSFDTTIDTDFLGPVVIRGEGLYQKDVRTQIIDKAKLAIGNLTEAFTSQKGDRFKYVIGADITALTNMMVSAQFIQDRNLDFVDTTTTLTNSQKNSTATTYDTDVVGARYTADMAAMSMQNGYQKAIKNKEFYSLFLSKPYGSSQQHRWNNIFIYEENGGKWNRLDTEYSLSDNAVLTAEYNKYWGNPDTQFGQFKNSSNVQLGVKYSF